MILEIDRTSSEDDLKVAYRRLAKKFHPDLNGGDRSGEERFREINEAYEFLTDNGLRAAYDAATDDSEPVSGAGFRPAGADWTASWKTTVPRDEAPMFNRRRRRQAEKAQHHFYSRFRWGVLAVCAATAVYAGSHLAFAPPFIKSTMQSDHAAVTQSMPASASLPATNSVSNIRPVAIEAIPPGYRKSHVHGPAIGLLIPDQAHLKYGFAFSLEDSAYTATGYKTIYSIETMQSQEYIAFSENIDVSYVPFNADMDVHPFSFHGTDGSYRYRVISDGTVDGELRWDDHGKQLAIHAYGFLPSAFGASDLISLLGPLKRVMPDQPTASAIMASPTASETPCHPGTACYESQITHQDPKIIYRGRHIFLRRQYQNAY